MAVVTVEEALQLWDEALQTQVHKVETIDVKAAKGYVLAEDIIAPTDVPAFPKSAMDGYAIAFSADCNEYIVDGVIGRRRCMGTTCCTRSCSTYYDGRTYTGYM